MLTSNPTAPVADENDCQGLAQIMGRIGDKWSIMVVGQLLSGRLRFNELVRHIRAYRTAC